MKSIIILICCVMSFACATSQEELLPTGNTTMLDLWQKNGNATLGDSRSVNKRKIEAQPVSYNEQVSYTRIAENETKNLFPRLPNPDLVMYVFPHLSQSSEPVPIPGYSTVIPFYGRVQYAQPGERTREF